MAPLDDLPKLTWPTARLLAYYDIGPLAGQFPPPIPDDLP